MSLLTPSQRARLLENGKPHNRSKDHFPVVKLFLPGTGCTWLLTELEEDNIAFGLCDLGLGFPELGYVSLDELQNLKSRLGLSVERDIYFRAEYPLSIYRRAADDAQHITDNCRLLMNASLG